jgi:cytochrome c-type biogenesis protein CcmH
MIYLWMLGLTVLLMAPLLMVFGRKDTRNRREAALSLHRAQLEELARDLTDARIAPAEYKAAKLEVERRLLAADTLREAPWNGNARFLLWATVLAVPVMAFALYLPGSTPTIPSEPHGKWLAEQQALNAQRAALITKIRARLASEDPNSADASQGKAYLGEFLAEQAGTITPEALSLFQQSLAHAPPDADWRGLDEERITQATGKSTQN